MSGPASNGNCAYQQRGLGETVHGPRGIAADSALRLARYFQTTPKFWLSRQISYDLAVSAERIEKDVRPREAA